MNPHTLADDIDHQLMVYRKKEDGRIEYLALTDKPHTVQNNSNLRASTNTLDIKRNQMGLLDSSKQFSRSSAPEENIHQILLDAANINK